MHALTNIFTRKQKIIENTAFLYLKSLLIFFGPPICTVFLIHISNVFHSTSSAWIAVGVALLIPFGSLLAFLIDISILKHEPIIYNLSHKKENMLNISTFLLIKTLAFLLSSFFIMKTFHINNITNTTLNIPFILFIYITGYILTDLFFYLSHRFLHQSKFLYRHFHSHHHQATTTSIFTNHRMSLFDLVIPNFIISIILLIFLGYCCNLVINDTYNYLIGNMLAVIQIEYISLLGHSNREYISHKIIKIFPFNVLSTNVMHSMHHARIKINYGAFLKIWDIIFKTFSDDHDAVLKRVSEGVPLIKLSERVVE